MYTLHHFFQHQFFFQRKCDVSWVQEVFHLKLQANLIVYNATISAYERSGLWQEALELLSQAGGLSLPTDRPPLKIGPF